MTYIKTLYAGPFKNLLVETRGGDSGVITSCDGSRVKVLLAGGAEIDTSMSELSLVRPVKKDQIIVVRGDFLGQVKTSSSSSSSSCCCCCCSYTPILSTSTDQKVTMRAEPINKKH
jgi:hypothetical protein